MVMKFIAGNRKFQQGLFDQEREFMISLAEGQQPLMMYIGCSDSRVVPELLTMSRPGDLFVTRNVANIVPPSDRDNGAVGAAVEYAIGHLKVQHIVICGHYKCGGIEALDLDPVQLNREPYIARWLQWARPILELPAASLKNRRLRHEALVAENVMLQLRNLRTYSAVQDALEEGLIRLHGWIYDLETGSLLAYNPDAGRFTPPV